MALVRLRLSNGLKRGALLSYLLMPQTAFAGACQLQTVKIVVEKHDDGYVAYPLGIDGVVVGEGDSYQEALADVKSALEVYAETFGTGCLEGLCDPS